jgi:hypothetical protein
MEDEHKPVVETNARSNPYEIFEDHKKMISSILVGLSDSRRLGIGLVKQIISKLNGPSATESVHPQQIGGVFSDSNDHIQMTQAAMKGNEDHEEKLWETTTSSRFFPDTQAISMSMNDNEYKIGSTYDDGRTFQLEIYSEGNTFKLQIIGPLELVTPENVPDQSSWRLPIESFTDQQKLLMVRARGEATDERFISVKIDCSIIDVSKKKPEDSLTLEVEIIYVRIKNDLRKFPKTRRWQVVRIQNDGTEIIDNDRALSEAPRMFQPKFDKKTESLLNQNTLEPQRG